mgnify:CR=1 FL=1
MTRRGGETVRAVHCRDKKREKKVTQAELAEKIHVTDKAISRWERGLGFSRYPDIRTTGTGTWNFGTGIDAF